MNAPTCLKFGGCPVGVWRVSGGCLKGFQIVSGESPVVVSRVCGGYIWDFQKVWGVKMYLKGK